MPEALRRPCQARQKGRGGAILRWKAPRGALGRRAEELPEMGKARAPGQGGGQPPRPPEYLDAGGGQASACGRNQVGDAQKQNDLISRRPAELPSRPFRPSPPPLPAGLLCPYPLASLLAQARDANQQDD